MGSGWEYRTELLTTARQPGDAIRLDAITEWIDAMRRAGWTLSSIIGDSADRSQQRYLLTFRRRVTRDE